MQTPVATTSDGNSSPATPNGMEGTKSIRQSVVSGSVWTVAGFGAGQLLRLGGNIILAAILYQEAFALMAIASAVVQGLTMFSDIGLGPSVVQNRRGDDRDFLNTAWTIQVIRGVMLTILAVALSQPLAAFYAANDPKALELQWLLPMVAIGTLIGGFQSSNLMTATRHINLRRLTTIDLAAQIVGLVVMITTAWLTGSVYALALGTAVGAATHCSLGHLILTGQRNRFCWDKEAVHEIVHFGKWVFLSTLITFFAMQIDKLLFARLFPLKDVGVYSIAAGLAVLTPMLMGRLQTMIAFPLYSRMVNLDNALEPVVHRSKIPMLTVGGYLVALSIAGAQTFIEFAYDERYAAAGLYIPILAAGAWFAVIDGIYGAAFLATGRARWVALVNGTKVGSFCVLVGPATHFAGLLGAVVAVAASDVIKLGVALNRARSIGLKNQRPEMMFTLYTVVTGVGVGWITTQTPFASNWPPLVLLFAQFALCTLAFLPPLRNVARTLVRPKTQTPDSGSSI